MSKRVSIIPATEEHIPLIVANMRQADIDELAQIGKNPTDSLKYSLAMSRFSCTGFVGSEAVCMFGVCPSSFLTPLKGYVWMFSTTNILDHQVAFLRRCKPVISQMLNIFPVLENWVSVENRLAIKWLRWMKFKFDEPVDYGPFNKKCMRFHMKRV